MLLQSIFWLHLSSFYRSECMPNLHILLTNMVLLPIHARQVTNGDAGSRDTRSPRLQKIGWDAQGMPDLGVPVRIGAMLSKPSGTIK